MSLRAWQSWKNSKPVAVVVVLALTIGIGSATAVYTVVNALLLTPVPFAHGERFVSVLGASFDDPNGMSSVTLKDALEYQRRTHSFDLFGWFVFADYNLTSPGQPQHINGVEVTPALVNGLGVNPRLGRWFQNPAELSAVLSYPLWMRLGGDAAILGKPLTLNGRVYTVSGVMPPGFNLPLSGVYTEGQMDIWLPLDPLAGETHDRGNTFCYARLRPGVSLAAASADVKRVAAEIARREPASHPAYSARVDNLHWIITKDIRPILLLLLAAAELLLLITCANVGGLLVARSVARARETAVRIALGAGLRQLAAQYFAEALLVALLGAAGGLLLSFALIRALAAFAGQQSARIANLSMDWRVPVFAVATAVLAGALAAIAPLWQSARMLPNEVLSEGVRSTAGARSRRLSRSLVVGEIALALVLLSLSTVLLSELYRLMRVSPGFVPDHLLTFQLTVVRDTIPGKPGRVAYQDRLVRALTAIPGTAGVGFTNEIPLDGCCMITAIYPEGSAANPQAPDHANFLAVSPGYFSAMRIPLRRGRFLDERDTGEQPLATLIDETAARRYWPNRDPVGLIGHFGDPHGDPFRVVGIVADVRNNGLDNPTVPEIYLPAAVVDVNPMKFVVRSPLPAKTLVPQVLRAIHNVNPVQPIHGVQTMDAIVQGSLALKRAASYVMTFFALAALLMAIIGAYGVVAYSVRQRTVEIGTRMALGALPRDLIRLVVGSGMKMAGWGIAIGGVAAIAATWALVRNFEIQVGNGGAGRLQNPGVLPFLISAAVVAAVAMASSWFPAWWATRLSPMVAIRDEPGARRARTSSPPPSEVRANAELAADNTLVTELVEASRRAGSYGDALLSALDAVRAAVQAESAMLLESAAGGTFRTTAAVPHSDRPCSIPAGGLLLSRLQSYGAPLPITGEDLDTWHHWAVEFAPSRLAEIESLSKAGAALVASLRTSRDIIGLLLLGRPVKGGEYSRADKRLLHRCADHFALMLENARLTDRVLEQEKLRRDLALAAEVQRRLLARQSLDNAAISLAAYSIPARSVGGDYFDLLELGDDRTGIALADVAGKGIPAALIMSVVQATLRVLSAEPAISLSDLVGKMNHFLYRSTGSSSYATFFYAQFDQRDRRLRYVNAGHNPPYVLRANSASPAMEELTVGGTVIGMFPQARYEEGAVDLRSGDVLMIFTDGVPEAQNPREEEFGEERLQTLFREVLPLPIDQMISRISQQLHDWIQDAAQYDDLTFVLMKVK
jgi:putative ABC transport system permease protein